MLINGKQNIMRLHTNIQKYKENMKENEQLPNPIVPADIYRLNCGHELAI